MSIRTRTRSSWLDDSHPQRQKAASAGHRTTPIPVGAGLRACPRAPKAGTEACPHKMRIPPLVLPASAEPPDSETEKQCEASGQCGAAQDGNRRCSLAIRVEQVVDLVPIVVQPLERTDDEFASTGIRGLVRMRGIGDEVVRREHVLSYG